MNTDTIKYCMIEAAKKAHGYYKEDNQRMADFSQGKALAYLSSLTILGVITSEQESIYSKRIWDYELIEEEEECKQ